MWEIVHVNTPFVNMNPTQAAMHVIHHNMRPTISLSVPKPVRQLITQCWHPSANLRPKSAAITGILDRMVANARKFKK